jgi:two-component system, sensor histidine kinase and response regulator
MSCSQSHWSHLQKGNILIVDDTPNNLRLLSSMLSQQGYEVRSAISGSMALRAVHTVQPDLILLDINMPIMDGYEVCLQLKADEKTNEIPVIFLSALSESIDKVQAFRVGGADYITKPFQIEEVLARVENQLALRSMQIDLQQARLEALKALEQEKELNRLRSEFVSMVSHDFRNPLTSIQGFAELLRYGQQNLTEEIQNRYFGKINAAIAQMLNLLDEVLLIGSVDAGKVHCQPICLNLEQFCRDLTEMIELSAGDRHKICLTCTGTCTAVELDPTLLNKILSNLLSNAIKYSPAGGLIQFDIHCQDNLVTFRIQDEGIGIPLENQAHLFESFYRCSNVGQIKGTGLGLAVVKQCVDIHLGKILIESQEAVGTSIVVVLPRSIDAPDLAEFSAH